MDAHFLFFLDNNFSTKTDISSGSNSSGGGGIN